MITEPTTLILGAGASKPYNYPSGYELRKYLSSGHQLHGLTECGYSLQDIHVFSHDFLSSGKPIDAFLAWRGRHQIQPQGGVTFSDIGKAAIAYCLIKNERHDWTHAFPEDNWYEYLWRIMADSLDTFGDNKLRIITFNYDRSLEYYLLTALQKLFGISPEEAARQLGRIPILHVYGQLGALPEFPVDGLDVRPYSHETSYHAVRTAAKGIRVIDESRDDDVVFDQVFTYLKESRRICFLGFGFDETNMRRLRIDSLLQDIRAQGTGEQRIYATTLGLEEAERRLLVFRLNTTRYNGMPDLNPSHQNIVPYSSMKITQYLRASGALL